MSESCSLLDSSSDEILDALGMTENLGSKVDCILAQIVEMHKKPRTNYFLCLQFREEI